jgi:large subunit ribosomal protein L25
MSIIKLSAESRQETGSRACKTLRASGFIPANLYSHGSAPTALKLNAATWTKVVGDDLHLVMLEMPDSKPATATLREIQRDPMTQEIIHIDLLRVEMDEAVHFSVKVDYLGTPNGTKDGGVTQILTDHVEVECLPGDVPDMIKIDITYLGLSESLHARDLVIPEKVKLITDPDVTLVSVPAIRLTIPEPVAAVAAEVPEGEGEKEETEEKP